MDESEKKSRSFSATAVVAVVIAFLGLVGAGFTWFHGEFKTLSELQAKEELHQPWLERWLKVQEDRRKERSKRVDRLEERIKRLEEFHIKE